MEKQAQISMFIILGIVILVGGGSAVYLMTTVDSSGNKVTELKSKADMAPVELFITECLERTARDGLVFLGLQGGYYELPELYHQMEYNDVPYYYYKNDLLVPEYESILYNLGAYIDENIDYCLEDFEDDRGVELAYSPGKTEVTQTTDWLSIIMEKNVEVKESDSITSYSDFRVVQNVRLRDVYDVSRNLMVKVLEDPYYIDYSAILELMGEHNMQIDTIKFGTDTLVYVIQDKDSIVDGEPYLYLFSIKVDSENAPPEIFYLENQVAKVGEEFYFRVNAYDREDDFLEYEVVSDLVGINPYNGEIKFTPTMEDVGVHQLIISVSDGQDITNKQMTITVEV